LKNKNVPHLAKQKPDEAVSAIPEGLNFLPQRRQVARDDSVIQQNSIL
jgi:hypothetical protein